MYAIGEICNNCKKVTFFIDGEYVSYNISNHDEVEVDVKIGLFSFSKEDQFATYIETDRIINVQWK